MAEWSARDVDACWDAYTDGASRSWPPRGACDVLAHPDLDQGRPGYVPGAPAECWDRIAEAAASSGMAAELSSAGWRKPVAEQYPAAGAARALRRRAACRSPRPRTPTSSTTWPTGPTTCAPCWPRSASTSCRATGPGAAVRRAPPPRPAPRRGASVSADPGRAGASHTDLEPEELEHLQRLLGSWSVLADLSFSDLLLAGAGAHRRLTAPAESEERTPSWWCSARCGPTTAPPWSTRTWSARRSTSRSGRWWPSACTRARSCAAASTTRSWASRCPVGEHPGALRGPHHRGAAARLAGAAQGADEHVRADLPRRVRAPGRHGGRSRPSRSPTRTSAPRRRPGWATASWWSTPTGGWSSPRPTP